MLCQNVKIMCMYIHVIFLPVAGAGMQVEFPQVREDKPKICW